LFKAIFALLVCLCVRKYDTQADTQGVQDNVNPFHRLAVVSENNPMNYTLTCRVLDVVLPRSRERK